MSQSSATIMIQDSDEFVWLVTHAGVDRFNGYEFEPVAFDEVVGSNPQTQIVALLIDASDRVIAVSEEGNVFAYRLDSQKFTLLYESKVDLNVNAATLLVNNQLLIHGIDGFFKLDLSLNSRQNTPLGYADAPGVKNVTHLLNEKNEILWIVTAANKLYSLNQKSKRLVAHTFELQTQAENKNLLTLTPSIDGGVYAMFRTGELFKVRAENKAAFSIFHSDKLGLQKTKVQAITQTSPQYLWVTTRGEGLFQVDLGNLTTRQFKTQVAKRGGLSSNNLYAIFFDRQKQLWVSAPNGINYAQVEDNRFYHLGGNRAYSFPLQSLSTFNLAGFHNNILWVGSHDAGASVVSLTTGQDPNRQKRSNNVFSGTSLVYKKVDSHRFVSALTICGEGVAWLGFPNSIERFDAVTAENLGVNSDWRAIGEKGISAIHCADNDRIVSTNDNTIHFQSNNGPIISIPSPVKTKEFDLSSIVGPVNNSYWLGSDNTGQLLQFDRASHEIKLHLLNYKDGTPLDSVNALWLTPQQELWIGTRGKGIVRINLQSQKMSWLNTRSELADNYVYAILGDALGNVWITGNKGLTRYSTETNTAQKFTVEDGLQSNEFNSLSAFRSEDGLLFFGGANGITVVDEKSFTLNQHIPKTYIQEAVLLTGDEARKLNIFDASATEILNYRSNSLAFKIGAIDLLNPKGISFTYRLLGNSDEWANLGNNRNINFLNLAPGDYQLEVKSCNSDGICNPVAKTVKFHISAPPWLSIWAYIAYGLLALFIIVYFVKRQQAKFIYQQQVAEKERQIANELRELNALKDEFLTNTSHELRTPLNGIIGLSQFLKSEADHIDSNEAIESLEAINQCGVRLNKLVDDLLDYSQLTNKRLILKREPFDINLAIEQITLLLQPQCARQNLTLKTQLPDGALFVDADQNRIRQVLSNLISNAIKFSDKGTITVSTKTSSGNVKVTVADQGMGIPSALQQKIFLSFTQLDGTNTRNKGGLGLGLAISKDIVELHGSQLELISSEGKGAEFSFVLPIHRPNG